MFMYFDPRYIFFVMLPALVLTGLASWWVRSAYQKASRIPNMQHITGAQAARRILDSAGLSYVNIEPTGPIQQIGPYQTGSPQPVPGRAYRPAAVTPQLNDHYDPSSKVLRLSPSVYAGTSVAALGVAAHEAGHAVQDAEGYPWMRARTAIVPAANIGTNIGWILMFAGLILHVVGIAWLGFGAFALGVVFALLTLPVEINASTRAMKMLTANGLVDRTEYGEARSVLTAAGFTYVAGLAVSLLNMLYWAMLVSGMGGRSRN